MVVVEGRTVDRIKLGGWVYQMIKLSKARRSLVWRWSMMWSLVQFRVVGFGVECVNSFYFLSRAVGQ